MAAVTAEVGEGPIHWRLLVRVGVVSVLTVPLTAIWFLFSGCAVLIGSATYAAAGEPADQASRLQAGASIAIGLLIGPSIYLALAALT